MRLLWLLLIGLPLQAAEAPTILKVGLIEFNPIAAYEQDMAGGYLVDYVRGIFADAGIQPHYLEVSVNRSLEQLKNKKLDAVLYLFKSPERESFIRYSAEPLLQVGAGFCTMIPVEKKPITASTKLTHVRGTILHPFLEKLAPFPVISEKAQIRMLQMLVKGRVDAASNPKPEVFFYTARQMGLTQPLYCYEIKDSQRPMHMAFSFGLPDGIVQRLNASLEKKRKVQTFEAYFRQQLEKAAPTPEIRIFDPASTGIP